MLKLSHKKLKVWKQSMILIKSIYQLTESFPKEEKFGLTSQLKRAAISTASNISEGAARKSKKEKRRFYEIARSSLVEIDTQVVIAIELEFIADKEITELTKMVNKIFAMLSGLIKS